MFSSLFGTIFFWTVFLLVTPWVLNNFYVSYRETAVKHLRRGTLGMSGLLLMLFFVPWLSPAKASLSGWDMLLTGRWDVALYIVSLFSVFVLTVWAYERTRLLSAAAAFEGIAVVLLFTIMIRVNPVIKNLTLADLVPIASIFLLLINALFLLLLIQQLQLKQKGNH